VRFYTGGPDSRFPAWRLFLFRKIASSPGREAGIRVGISSSGRVWAQKLVFGHTENGDLTPFLPVTLTWSEE
jgi:hypothetical protein